MTPTPSRTPSATFVHQCIDDGDCTQTDVCILSSRCVSYVCIHERITCQDDNPCTYDVCDPILGCLYPDHNGIACDDENDCTEDDLCVGGECVGTDVTDGTVCVDGDACTEDDHCIAGACTGTDIDCALFYPHCMLSSCNPLIGCQYAPILCPDDGDPLTLDICDPATGRCVHPARVVHSLKKQEKLNEPWYAVSAIFLLAAAIIILAMIAWLIQFFMTGGGGSGAPQQPSYMELQQQL